MSNSQVAIHTTEIDITDFPTKTVTFAPTRATVTREIEGIHIQPGANEVIISGLDPNIDPDSVRVDGYGLATITDIQAETILRKEQFQDRYPDLKIEDEEDEDGDNLADFSDDDYGVDKTAVENAKQELQSAESNLANFRNSQEGALKVLSFLDTYGQSMKAQEVDVPKLSEFLTVYRDQRTLEGKTHQDASTEIALWSEKVDIAREKLSRAETAFKKAKELASQEVRLQREKEARERNQKRLQKQRLTEQRPFTPNSSRRQSLTSVTEKNVEPTSSKPLEEDCVNLLLTYVVPGARWTPRYELKISTPKSSAELVYRAEFENNTSETWKDAKITFSTSQTFFSGLDERIPVLEPWHIKSGKAVKGSVATSGIQSRKEMVYNHSLNSAANMKRAKMAGFGNINSAVGAADVLAASQIQQQQLQRQLQQQQQQQQQLLRYPAMELLRSQMHPNMTFGNDPESESDDDADGLTLSPETYSITHQDSIRQDYGLTTTYDLPGQRTLEPSTVKRRHVIAELHLASVTLSHVLIPKLRRAAFLKARISNTTSVSLLRGKAGMTVDGTFLGSTTLPSCEPGQFINLSLGTDPSVLVIYAKPTAHRATTGFFTKENSVIFSRSCWIKNTKKNEVSITIFDQVPVSEDEQLRISILEPKGLVEENSVAQLNEVFKNGDNGQGKASLGKDGQVKWDIRLRPGKEVKLALRYETRIPAGQQIIGMD